MACSRISCERKETSIHSARVRGVLSERKLYAARAGASVQGSGHLYTHARGHEKEATYESNANSKAPKQDAKDHTDGDAS
jgi:hypothetical protein